MPAQSVFADEWRECLRAHYMYVQRLGDYVTERTLHGVMTEVGFSEAELKELTVLATMRVEEMDEDFVPDMDILAAEEPAVIVPAAVVPEVATPEAAAPEAVEEVPEVEMDEREIDDEIVEEAEPESSEEDDDSPQQMSMF